MTSLYPLSSGSTYSPACAPQIRQWLSVATHARPPATPAARQRATLGWPDYIQTAPAPAQAYHDSTDYETFKRFAAFSPN